MRSLSSTGCHLGLTGKSTKCPWVGVVEVTAGGINRETFIPPLHPHAFNPTATTHGNFVLSPVSLASRDQDGGPSDSTIMQHLRSHGKIGDCEQSTSLARKNLDFPKRTSISLPVNNINIDYQKLKNSVQLDNQPLRVKKTICK